MKVELWLIGKTSPAWLQQGMDVYEKRLRHYLSFDVHILPPLKNTSKLPVPLLIEKEGEVLLKLLQPDDYLVLLDERGQTFTSKQFAAWMERQMVASPRRLIFAVGGAFGFSQAVRRRSNFSISLSAMTFSHQMVRLFFLEQLYRAMTIIRGEAYHND
ncbi:MAG: ribosomal RNA large subunit methyltransferase H [Saprospiraceae bacterium]|nr:MAG: ribosomal RNA large subunit methyltransferase H [Saprospiraceae bacterium]